MASQKSLLGLIWCILLLFIITEAASLTSEAVPLEARGDPKEPGPPQGWPHIDVIASYRSVNITRLRDAVKCLTNWCDNGERLWALGGKARCVTDHEDGGDVAAWVCNLTGAPMRCSTAMVFRSVDGLLSQAEMQGTSEETGSTGTVWYSSAPQHHLLFGFDYHCNGRAACGQYYDSVQFCDSILDVPAKSRKSRYRQGTIQAGSGAPRKPLQYKGVANAYDATRHEGTVVKGGSLDDCDSDEEN